MECQDSTGHSHIKKVHYFKGSLDLGVTHTHRETKISAYLKIICFIVVHVQGPVQLTVSGYRQLLSARDPVVDGLPCILLHLNVVKLTEIAKPLDELRGNASVELLNLNSKKDKSTDIPPPSPISFKKHSFLPFPTTF